VYIWVIFISSLNVLFSGINAAFAGASITVPSVPTFASVFFYIGKQWGICRLLCWWPCS
jgi:hypothetical protein